MDVVIVAKKADTYSTRRLVSVLREKNHSVNFISPLDCTLSIDGGVFDIISSGSTIPIPNIALLRSTAYTEFGTTIGRAFETYLGMQLKLSGTICINDPEAKFRASSKFLALQILNHAGIPVPATFLTWDSANIEWIAGDYLGTPLIVKMNEGTWGMGVELAEDTETARTLVKTAGEMKRITLAQEYITAAQEQDVRVLVVGGQVIGAMRRIPPAGNFRSNAHQGSKAERIDLPKEYADLAVLAARALELEIAGIDILETETGPLVLEANPSPGLEQIETVTNIDIATQIVEFLESR
jgi:ribosomal protein S6--L-glutamate ligase